MLGAALQFKYLLVDPVKYDVKYQVTTASIYSLRQNLIIFRTVFVDKVLFLNRLVTWFLHFAG